MIERELFSVFRDSEAIDLHDPAFLEPVDVVNKHLNDIGVKRFVEIANNDVRRTSEGMEYILVGGGKDRSSDSAIIMPGTFGNGIWPHLIARAEALAFMTQQAGMVDPIGNTVPVLLTASPSTTSSFGLDEIGLAEARNGNYALATKPIVTAITDCSIKRVSGAVGTSQGSVFVPNIFNNTDEQYDFKDSQAVLVEPGNTVKREILPVARQTLLFALEGISFKRQVSAEGIDVIDELLYVDKPNDGFYKGLWKSRSENLAMVRGFSKGKIWQDIQDLKAADVPTTVIVGSKSLFTKKDTYYGWGKLVNVEGATHSLGDRIGRFATLCAANLVAA